MNYAMWVEQSEVGENAHTLDVAMHSPAISRLFIEVAPSRARELAQAAVDRKWNLEKLIPTVKPTMFAPQQLAGYHWQDTCASENAANEFKDTIQPLISIGCARIGLDFEPVLSNDRNGGFSAYDNLPYYDFDALWRAINQASNKVKYTYWPSGTQWMRNPQSAIDKRKQQSWLSVCHDLRQAASVWLPGRVTAVESAVAFDHRSRSDAGGMPHDQTSTTWHSSWLNEEYTMVYSDSAKNGWFDLSIPHEVARLRYGVKWFVYYPGWQKFSADPRAELAKVQALHPAIKM